KMDERRRRLEVDYRDAVDVRASATRASDAAAAMSSARAAVDAARARLVALPRHDADDVERAKARAAETRDDHGRAVAERKAACSLVSDGFDGTCPVMRRPCPAANAVESATDAARERMAAADESVEATENARSEAAAWLRKVEEDGATRVRLTEAFN